MVTMHIKSPLGTTDGEYTTVATVQAVDGRLLVDDPHGYVPLDASVMTPQGAVTSDSDPEAWVTNLPTLLRTGYLVPVLDDDAPATQMGSM